MQIIVYTGAILMLFLFVLMLVGVDASDSVVETIRGQRLLAILGGLAARRGARRRRRPDQPRHGGRPRRGQRGGNIEALANILFSRYVFAFEVTSALLITAAVGAMVLAHRERLTPKPTQASMAAERVREYAEPGQHLGPLPPPGVFARHNAVGTPALLPDGTRRRVVGLPGAGGPRDGPPAPRDVEAVQRHRRGRRTRPTVRRPRPTRRTASLRARSARRDDDDRVRRALRDPLHDRRRRACSTRRNAIVVFMCVELMLNACNLALVTFAKQHGNLDGQIAAFFVMVVAAAEVVVGLAIIMTIFRTRRSASVDDASLLKY